MYTNNGAIIVSDEKIYIDDIDAWFQPLECNSVYMRILHYIVNHMDYNNVLHITITQLAQETKTSRRTVKRFLNDYEENNLLCFRNNRIMISKDFLHKGPIHDGLRILI